MGGIWGRTSAVDAWARSGWSLLVSVFAIVGAECLEVTGAGCSKADVGGAEPDSYARFRLAVSSSIKIGTRPMFKKDSRKKVLYQHVVMTRLQNLLYLALLAISAPSTPISIRFGKPDAGDAIDLANFHQPGLLGRIVEKSNTKGSITDGIFPFGSVGILQQGV